MINIEINNLQSYLAENEDNKTLVLLSSEGCHHCGEFKTFLEGQEESFPDLTFVEVLVDIDTKPLFGPPVIPSIVGFEMSQRVLEGAGMPDNLQAATDLLQAWVNGEGFQYSAG